MSSALNSFKYKIEKYKIEKVFGLKKIAWIWIILTAILLTPAYFAGYYFSDVYHASIYKKTPSYTKKILSPPEYEIGQTNTLLFENGERSLYIKINNKKEKTIGYYPWVYTYEVYDISDNILQQETVTSYLLPEEEVYVVVPIGDKKGIKLKIETDADLSQLVDYNADNQQYFEEPEISVTSKTLRQNQDNKNLLDIGFILKNENYLNIKKVDVYYVLRSVDQRIIGIGKYGIDNLSQNEEKVVNFTYPKPTLGIDQNLEVITRINFLDVENISID